MYHFMFVFCQSGLARHFSMENTKNETYVLQINEKNRYIKLNMIK